MDLAHRRLREIRLHPEPLDHLPVELHTQPRLLRHGQVPAHHRELLQQGMRIDVDAVDRRPARLFQHRTQMGGQGSGQPGAHHLQPERHLRLAAQNPIVERPPDSAAQHEPVAHPFADSRHRRWTAEVHGNGTADLAPQQRVAGHVVLRNRRFDDGQVRVLLLQPANQRRGHVHPQQQRVEVRVQAEMRRHRLAHRRQLRVDIVPGPRLHLHGRKSVFLGRPRFGRPLLGLHALRPPRQRTGFPVLRPQQPVAGHAEHLAGRVEQRHLQTRAQRVVPEQIEQILPPRPGELRVPGMPPGVPLNSLPHTHCTTRRGHLAQLHDRPPRPVRLHSGRAALVERHVQHDPLYLFDNSVF